MKVELPAVEIETLTGRFRIVMVVDVEKLARILGRRAARSKLKRATTHNRAIVVEAQAL